MDINSVYSALRQDLASISGILPISWENVEYRSKGTAYLKVSILPAPSVAPMFGLGAPQRYEGVLQLLVLYPAGKGTKDIDLMVKKLLDHYTRGLTLTNSGNTVLILKSWRGPGVDLDAYFQIPVSVQFQSYLIP
jgi:hypothetical protein